MITVKNRVSELMPIKYVFLHLKIGKNTTNIFPIYNIFSKEQELFSAIFISMAKTRKKP